MHANLPPSAAIDRTIDIRLTPRSVAPKVLPALQALGYILREDDEPIDKTVPISGFWLVDESRLDELPNANVAPAARILLISSPRKYQRDDIRILARTTRPARLSAIYSMIQSILENQPRKTPRIQTQLSARCIRADRRSIGAVLSLSEGGCLLRTGDSLRRGTKVDLQFALPEYGLVSTRAACRYKRSGDAGLEFSEPAADIRHSIAHFVTVQLAEANGGSGVESLRSA
jgi:hypothetical protein